MRQFLALLILLFSANAFGQVNAATCNTSDVQSAINAATEGQTVTIPAGTCTWTSGVSWTGKGIAIQGAGSGRVIAYDNGSETPTIGAGTKTFAIAGYSPGLSSSSITNGETLRVFETNSQANYMQGTVTSLSGGTLTMNITSTGGSGSTHRWLISTLPTTVLIDNASNYMFNMTEDTSFNQSLSGIQMVAGTSTASAIPFLFKSGGQPMLLHDNWFQLSSNYEIIDSTTNRGVIWNNTFTGSTANNNQLTTTAALRIKGAPTTSWTTPSTWGAADTTGTGALYFETNDVHVLQSASDNDDNGRMVWRYNLMDSSTVGTHGADTSNYGERYFEYYQNTGIFFGYSDGSTFNVANGWVGLIRGGTFVMWGNTLPAITSQDYGTKADALMIVMNLQRNAGPDPCWGAGGSAGQYYYAPRQVGMGYVTGSGRANYPPDGVNNSPTDSVTYVGDSEPAYMWGNSRQPLTNVIVEDYGIGNTNGCPSSPTPDSSSNYLHLNRDYFNGSTPKPGYSPYTYPHPLTTGTPQASTPTFAPVAGTYTGTQSIVISTGSGGVICYTTNGSTPTTNGSTNCTIGTKYASPVSVASSQTLKAVAGGTGFSDSFTGSAAYTILTQAVTPTFSPTAGTYTGTQNISISTTTGSVICYSLTVTPATNGTTGCSAGSLYSSAVAVAATGILRAVAGGTGLTDSSVGSAGYTINNFPLAPPTQFTGNTVITGPTGVH